MITTVLKTLASLNPQLRAQFITTLLFRSGTMAFPFLAAYLLGQGRYDAAAIGLVVAAFGAGALLADLSAGPLLQRVPARTVMLGALTLNAAVLVVAPAVSDIWLLLALTFFWGVCYEAYTPANYMATVTHSSEAERKIAFSCNRLAINIGMGIGPALGGLLFAWAPSALFYLNAAMVLAAALFYALATRHAGRAQANKPAPTAVPATPAGASAPAGDGRFWAVFGLALPIHLAYALPPTLLGAYVINQLGLPSWWAGLLFSANAFCVVLFELPLNVAMQKLSHARSLTIGYSLAAAGFMLMGVSANPFMLLAGTLLWTLGEMIVFPSLLYYVSEVSAPQQMGRNMGLYSAGVNIGLMAAPQLALALGPQAGAQAWWLSGALVAAALLLILAIRRQPRLWLVEQRA
jgi:predicted MFS family arabinose efflux permease